MSATVVATLTSDEVTMLVESHFDAVKTALAAPAMTKATATDAQAHAQRVADLCAAVAQVLPDA